jgi:hypothetical protein
MKKIIILAITLIFIVHFIIFPKRIGKETFFILKDDLRVSQASLRPESDGERFAFKLDDYFGYLDEQTQLSYLIELEHRVQASHDYFIVFDGEQFVHTVKNNRALAVGSIEAEGVPFIQGHKVFFIDAPSGRLQLFQVSGELLWSYDVGSFISAFYSNEAMLAVGTLDGRVVLLDYEGQELGVHRPEGSRLKGIYGIGISPSGAYVGVVAGVDPQRFILFQRGMRGYTPIFHQNMNTNFRRTVQVVFDEHENFVYYEGLNELFMHKITDSRKEVRSLPTGGQLRTVKSEIIPGFIAVLSTHNNESHLQIVSGDGRFSMLDVVYQGESPSLVKVNQGFVLGLNDTLLYMGKKDN